MLMVIVLFMGAVTIASAETRTLTADDAKAKLTVNPFPAPPLTTIEGFPIGSLTNRKSDCDGRELTSSPIVAPEDTTTTFGVP